MRKPMALALRPTGDRATFWMPRYVPSGCFRTTISRNCSSLMGRDVEPVISRTGHPTRVKLSVGCWRLIRTGSPGHFLSLGIGSFLASQLAVPAVGRHTHLYLAQHRCQVARLCGSCGRTRLAVLQFGSLCYVERVVPRRDFDVRQRPCLVRSAI